MELSRSKDILRSAMREAVMKNCRWTGQPRKSQGSMGANIDNNVEVTEKDRIVTLSTCNGIDDQRYLVQGVLLSEVDVTNN